PHIGRCGHVRYATTSKHLHISGGAGNLRPQTKRRRRTGGSSRRDATALRAVRIGGDHHSGRRGRARVLWRADGRDVRTGGERGGRRGAALTWPVRSTGSSSSKPAGGCRPP